MLKLKIPGRDKLDLQHLVLDFNGTIAHDGQLIEGLEKRLETLSEQLSIHVITADTNGTAAAQCKGLPVSLHIIGKANHALEKELFVKELGPKETACVGNGLNDRGMFSLATLAIAIVGREGCNVPTLLQSDIAVNSILDGLDLFIHRHRLIATLRN